MYFLFRWMIIGETHVHFGSICLLLWLMSPHKVDRNYRLKTKRVIEKMLSGNIMTDYLHPALHKKVVLGRDRKANY